MSNHLLEMRDVIEDLYRQQEAIINDQLGDLIKKGILVVEITNPVLVKNSFDQYKVELRQGIKVTVREREYIKKVEDENSKLKEQLERIREAAK